MNDGRKNVPFALPDEEDEDVFSSVEVDREDDVFSSAASQTSSMRTSGGFTPVQPDAGSGPGSRQSQQPGRVPQHTPVPVTGPRLTVESASQPGARTADVDREVFIIGREDAHLELHDQYVSTFHAQVRLEDGAAILQDLGSENGVYLRIADDLQLEDHDEIVLGNQRFVFRTSWDAPTPPASPYERRTPILGGNLPADATRLIQQYSGGQIGGVWRVGERLTIGRQNADVSEPDDAWLSSPHAAIERRSGKFFIKDQGSQYGTYIRVLDSVELIDGDCFVVGRSRIKISYP